MAEIDFGALIEDVALIVWGKPNKELSNARELRFGTGGGRVAYLDGGGNWEDFTDDTRGGVLDLIIANNGGGVAEAMVWLRDHNLIEADPDYQRSEGATTQREDHAQQVEQSPKEARPKGPAGTWTMVKSYPYTDQDGELMYEVCRVQWKLPDGTWRLNKLGKIDKTFIQRRPARIGDDSWIWGLKPGEYMRSGPGRDWRKFDKDKWDGIQNGERRHFSHEVEHGLYRWPDIEIAVAENRPVFIVEGEKAVEAAVSIGLDATCNSGGAKKFHDGLLETFRGADVVILPDNDPQSRKDDGTPLFNRDGSPKRPGQDHADMVARKLKGIAARVRVFTIPGLAEKGDIADWVEAGGNKLQFLELIKGCADWTSTLPTSSFGAVRVSQLSGSKIVYDWLIKGLVERGGVFFVAGEKQSGKSFFVIDMGMKIAMGEDYCGRKVTKGLVIHQAGEDGRGVTMRVEGYRRDKNIAPDAEIPFVVFNGQDAKKLNLMSDESVEAFIQECLAWEAWFGIKLELIFIDTFSVATEGLDEISSKEVGQVLARINHIARQCACAVGVVHHLNAEGKRMRGSSVLSANVAQVIEIRPVMKLQTNRNLPPETIKDANGRVVRKVLLEKNKNGPNMISWRFVLRQINLDLDDDGFMLTTCVMDQPSAHDEPGEAKTGRLSNDQKLVFDALRDATAISGEPAPPGIKAGSQVKRVVKKKDFALAVNKVWQYRAPIGDAEACKKELSEALRRNVTALINQGYVGQDNDLGIIWDMKKGVGDKTTVAPPDKLPDDVAAELQRAADGMPF